MECNNLFEKLTNKQAQVNLSKYNDLNERTCGMSININNLKIWGNDLIKRLNTKPSKGKPSNIKQPHKII
jgi:hypothetical protein